MGLPRKDRRNVAPPAIPSDRQRNVSWPRVTPGCVPASLGFRGSDSFVTSDSNANCPRRIERRVTNRKVLMGRHTSPTPVRQLCVKPVDRVLVKLSGAQVPTQKAACHGSLGFVDTPAGAFDPFRETLRECLPGGLRSAHAPPKTVPTGGGVMVVSGTATDRPC